jgi:hypothetical protein
VYDAGLRITVDRDGILSVSTPIRDHNGRLVATIDNNEWRVYSGATDKNYTDNSLEVLDLRGHVVLQVTLLDDRVQIQGEWRDEFGKGCRLRQSSPEDPLHKGMEMGLEIWDNKQGEEYFEKTIPPRFKYPSNEHWRELVDQVKPQ